MKHSIGSTLLRFRGSVRLLAGMSLTLAMSGCGVPTQSPKPACPNASRASVEAVQPKPVPKEPVAASSPPDPQLGLEALGLRRFPDREDMLRAPLPAEWLDARPLSEDDINADFSNFEDLAWLQDLGRAAKVVYLGENHYARTVYQLRARMIFALEKVGYSHVLMEVPYSEGVFYDYYVGLDDESAAAFRRDALHGVVAYEEELGFLEHVRQWNRLHPKRRVDVGGFDIEHQWRFAIDTVILPYLHLVKSDLAGPVRGNADWEPMLESFRHAVAIARAKGVVGQYPFVTADFVANVIDNVESIHRSKRFDFNFYRQQGIVRNLTSPRFLGRRLVAGKTVVHAGAYHAAARLEYPPDGAFLREAGYLAHEFLPTRGKVKAVRLETYGLRATDMISADPRTFVQQGTGNIRLLERLQKAVGEGYASRDDFLVESRQPDDLFVRLVLQSAQGQAFRPVLVERVDWDRLIERAGEDSASVVQRKNEMSWFDGYIFVPQSDMVLARVKTN